MLEAVALHREQVQHERQAFVGVDLQHVHLDELRDEGPSLLGRDLEGIDAQRQEDFGQAVFRLWLLVERLEKLGLVVAKDLLGDEQVRLRVVRLELEQQDLVVFAELQLVAVDALAKVVGRSAAPQFIKVLQALDCDGEDLPGGLQDAGMLVLQPLQVVRVPLLPLVDRTRAFKHVVHARHLISLFGVRI